MGEPGLSPPVLVAGAGSWGTALALVLARNGRRVYLWSHSALQVADLQKARCNRRYLPAHPFPAHLLPVADLGATLAFAPDLVLAVPCQGIRPCLAIVVRSPARPQVRICWATKGIEADTGLLIHEVVAEILGECPTAVLSGPSFAGEVALGLPTAVTLASTAPAWGAALSGYFHSDTFRVYRCDDVVGVEVGGAVKNVLAIAAGLADGLGLGANSRAALITRGLAEITRLGTVMGGQLPTFMGLSGLGDLVLTCTDDQSRNRRFGKFLGQGLSLAQAREAVGQVVEGERTAFAVERLAAKLSVEIPICLQVARILRQETTPPEALHALLTRDPTVEAVLR
jgi:glycerol-3-phosphate dehydrogenase (NAD(P)+)